MILIFCIHYFLWYGALTSIFGYESVYARHYTRATTMQYGYLNMVLPFITVIVTPTMCSLADRRCSHRAYFTLSLIVTMIAMSLFTMLPLVVGNDHQPPKDHSGLHPSRESGNLHIARWVYFCLASLMCGLAMGINTCLSDSFAVLQAEENNTNFGRIIVWGTFGRASSGLILCLINQLTFLPRLVPGLLFGTCLLAIDVLIVTYWTRADDFKLDTIPMDAARTLTGSTSTAHKEPSDYLPLNESARVNLGTEEIEGQSGPGGAVKQLRRKTKSPVEICAEALEPTGKRSDDDKMSAGLSLKTIESELDSILDPSKFANGGRKKESDSDSPYNRKSPVINKAPNEVKLTIAPAESNKVTDTGGQLKEEDANKSAGKRRREMLTSFRIQIILLCLIMQRRKALIRYFILFILSGFFMSMHWNYFFLFLEEILYKKFELLSALSMVGQSILGELPFFILSRKVIEQVGRSHTLSISVISIGLRFLLYGYLLPSATHSLLSSIIYIVVADCFQGPNYGLFYVVMTEVGLEYSFCDDNTIQKLAARGELDQNNKRQVDSVRLSLRSTVQSVAFACYEGLGVGLGSLVGGWIVASYGFKILWLSMAVGAIAVGVINMVIEFICDDGDKTTDDELVGVNSEQREFVEARRKGVLKRLASPQPLPPASQVRSPLIGGVGGGPFKFLQKVAQVQEVQQAPLQKAAGGGRRMNAKAAQGNPRRVAKAS